MDHLLYLCWKQVCSVAIPVFALAIWVGVTALRHVRRRADHKVPSLEQEHLSLTGGWLGFFCWRGFGSVFQPRETVAFPTELMKAQLIFGSKRCPYLYFVAPYMILLLNVFRGSESRLILAVKQNVASFFGLRSCLDSSLPSATTANGWFLKSGSLIQLNGKTTKDVMR